MTKRLLFIHHSTGGNLIHKGNLRKTLYSKTINIEFWDHGYNLYAWLPLSILKLAANKLTFHTGLSDKNGNMTGKDFQIQLSNNNPADFEKIFCADPKTNATLASILEFDIIMFKNCFPATKITSDEQLARYKENYINMANSFSKLNNKTFIAFTPPPLRKELTRPEYARRAIKFSRWMTTEWVKPTSVLVFDFFSELSNEQGFLKQEYCTPIFIDSHPNNKANIEIAPNLVNFLIKSINS